jgi:hypothetical protein
MKLLHAEWEKRNLGVDCTEVYFEDSDVVNSIYEAMPQIVSEYQVMHIPSGKAKLLLDAQKNGFQLIEMNIHLTKKIDNEQLPLIYKRYEESITVKEASENEICMALDEIKVGNIFLTDKVAKDPFFSTVDAGKRYAFWSRDIIDEGSHMYLAQYKGENVGFCLNIKKNNTTFDAFLGGTFSSYHNKGLGFLPLYANLYSIMLQGGKRVVTGVSSNNVPILKLHLLFGFRISSMSYILIKHL